MIRVRSIAQNLNDTTSIVDPQYNIVNKETGIEDSSPLNLTFAKTIKNDCNIFVNCKVYWKDMVITKPAQSKLASTDQEAFNLSESKLEKRNDIDFIGNELINKKTKELEMFQHLKYNLDEHNPLKPNNSRTIEDDTQNNNNNQESITFYDNCSSLLAKKAHRILNYYKPVD